MSDHNSSNSERLACSKIDKTEIVHEGNWINTLLITYTDPNGIQRNWEAIEYANKLEKQFTPDSVQVIAILKRKLHHNCFVLVQQFRPAVGCCSIEFPAGMVDKSDEDCTSAALRELHEETGFVGKIHEGIELNFPLPLEPGCQTSNISTVHVVIDGDDPRNLDCVQHLDEAEFIKVLIIPVRELLQRLNILINNSSQKTVVDSKLYSFAVGLHLGASLNASDNKALGVFS